MSSAGLRPGASGPVGFVTGEAGNSLPVLNAEVLNAGFHGYNLIMIYHADLLAQAAFKLANVASTPAD